MLVKKSLSLVGEKEMEALSSIKNQKNEMVNRKSDHIHILVMHCGSFLICFCFALCN